MSPDIPQKKVIVIVGPTAVGKTSLAIDLAAQISGEIISADSRYLYRGMDIGSAKPGIAERKGIPHHMIDVADPNETWSLAQYLEHSKRKINEVIARRHFPILVGGTGQYIRGLIQGWVVPEIAPDDKLREVLASWADEIGGQELYKRLAVVDPEACRFIEPTNVRRTIRALEVIYTTGEKFSTSRRKISPDYDFWVIGLNRPRVELYELVDKRIEGMYENGLVDEVKALLDKGYDARLPSMSAIGYREAAKYIKGDISLEEAKLLMRRNTRQFIRRQANWFKSTDPSIHWYSMNNDPLNAILSDLHKYFLDK